MPAKNEYQSRVSPIVLKGGRSRIIHSIPMNPAKASDAVTDNPMASLRLSHSASTDAASDAPIDAIAKYMNKSHPIIFPVL
jgi:hypothetical protein